MKGRFPNSKLPVETALRRQRVLVLKLSVISFSFPYIEAQQLKQDHYKEAYHGARVSRRVQLTERLNFESLDWKEALNAKCRIRMLKLSKDGKKSDPVSEHKGYAVEFSTSDGISVQESVLTRWKNDPVKNSTFNVMESCGCSCAVAMMHGTKKIAEIERLLIQEYFHLPFGGTSTFFGDDGHRPRKKAPTNG
ncbi:hypothetical protein DL96DRAFT_1675062 [Flagelloscypha sp. PMI_526]|nr:hypothetical protein DL96DRAFT_1675062 [Flagelloscypha sp. PMI_526]